MNSFQKIGYFGLVLFLFQCLPAENDPLKFIEDLQAKEILKKSFEYSGGLSNWKTVVMVQFEKMTTLYNEHGSVESTSNQLHSYFYQPASLIDISWQDSSGNHQITLRNYSSLTYSINQKETAGTEAQFNTALSSEYVATLPFKIINEENVINYLGIDTLGDNQPVHVIKTENTSAIESGSSDLWWHFFDCDTYRYAGYKVMHGDHVSLVLNITSDSSQKFMLPATRNSYRLDQSGDIDYLRAAYSYSNYRIIK